MNTSDFFPPRPTAAPTIYALASTHPEHAGLLKVGYTERPAVDRISEQFPSGLMTGETKLVESAMRADGSCFRDKDVHRHLRAKEKKEMTEAEKERKSLRKQVQEKLIKFAARVPLFMYLADFREQRLKDVITRLEPKLFKRVTGLTTADFERLVSLGVFNSALMNDAVWKFRRYEDASLRYMGVSRHRQTQVGLYDTALTAEDFEATFTGLVAEQKLS